MRMGLGVKGEKKAAMAPWQRMWHKSKAKTVATDEQKAGRNLHHTPACQMDLSLEHTALLSTRKPFFFLLLLLFCCCWWKKEGLQPRSCGSQGITAYILEELDSKLRFQQTSNLQERKRRRKVWILDQSRVHSIGSPSSQDFEQRQSLCHWIVLQLHATPDPIQLAPKKIGDVSFP